MTTQNPSDLSDLSDPFPSDPFLRDLFLCLGRSNRLEILEILQNSHSIGSKELQKILGMDESGVSRIMRDLRNNGLVERHSCGSWSTWSLNPSPLIDLQFWIQSLVEDFERVHGELFQGKEFEQ